MNFTSVLFHLDRKLSIFEETIIVAMETKFQIGDVVCLEWDKTKRFRVSSHAVVEGKIRALYFNELLGVIAHADIEPEYLKIAPKQD